MKNYRLLSNKGLFLKKYMYIEADEKMSASVFKKFNINVFRHKEYSKPDSKIRLVECKIPKIEEAKFLIAMEELKRNSLIMGYREYPSLCELLQTV